VGNIFLGDDGFGVEVAQRLGQRPWPPEVRVADFGIRGLDLAYTLTEPYDTVILIDVCAQGGEPGTLYVLQADIRTLDAPGLPHDAAFDAHGMNPLQVLQLATSLGAQLGQVLVVGCEPETFGPEEGAMGLSASVKAAIGPAIERITALIHGLLAGVA
jgi:hydrogenase maturation protease